MKPPKISDWDKTVKLLKKNNWLIETTDLKSGNAVFKITKTGLSVYKTSCWILNVNYLYDGEKYSESEMTARTLDDLRGIEKVINMLFDDDGYKIYLTPKGAEVLYVLTSLHNYHTTKAKPKTKSKPNVNKISEISIKVIKGTNQVSKFMGDLSNGMAKMGDAMSGDMGKSKKNKKKGNSYTDEYTKLGNKMMGGNGF